MGDSLFPAWTAVFGFVIGAFVGSFLNMAIYRLPRRLSFVDPSRSFCPRCKHSLSAIDLIPLLSWLSTGGKCRYCKEPVAVRYEVVELVTASIFAGIWYRFMTGVPNPNALTTCFYAVATAALVMIIFIDWELYIIPDELNAFLLFVAIAFAVATKNGQQGLYGGLLGWGLLWGIAFFGRLVFNKDAMGHGDIKMMRAVGILLGPLMVLANLGIAVVLGLVVGVTVILLTRKSAGSEEPGEEEQGVFDEPESLGSLLKFGVWYLLCLDVPAIFFPAMYKWIGETADVETIDDSDWKPSVTTIPFGPYLAAGAITCMLFGSQIERGLTEYWQNATHTGPAAIAVSTSNQLG